MSRTSPITVAAMAEPTPEISVTVVPDAPDCGGQLFLRRAQLGVDAAQAGGELGGQLMTGLLDGAGRLDLFQDAGRCGGGSAC